jgi:hypothetical protein
MQIQPQFYSVGNLLTGRLFRIPEYQRAYSWQSEQRKDLFDDIKKVESSGEDSSHFMATIVGLRRDKKIIAADEYVGIEVVDGQQRLTTLTVLLKSLAKALSESESKYSKEIESLLVKGDDLSLLLLQTNHDTSHIFVDYLRHGKVPKEGIAMTTADRNLVDAIAECEAFVGRWSNETGANLIQLFAVIKNRLSIIFHEIEDEALVYTVFEVLNSRGLDVTWFDKLKSLLMATVFENGDDGSKKETVSELHKLWTDIYRTIGLRQNLNRETVRFAGTLQSPDTVNRPLSEKDAVHVLVSACENDPAKVVSMTKWLLAVTRAENELLSNRRMGISRKIIQARLVAIAILLREFPKHEQDTILRKWESVTFRIYGLRRRDSRTKVGDYVRLAWGITNDKLSRPEIIEDLDKIGEGYPIDEVLQYLARSDRYKGWTDELRYFFFRYEEHLAKLAGQSINNSAWNRIWEIEPSRSIEHILPRSKGSEDRNTKSLFVHRLGNLMLLPPGVNSQLQDDDPADKAETYRSCGLLVATEVGKLIENGKWNRKAAENREKRLIEWAAMEWK